MQMGMGMHQVQQLVQTLWQDLSHEQKLEFKQLCQSLQLLRDPLFPNPVQGIAGMFVADEFLKSQNSVGILVGGLSEGIWKGEGKVRLERHKDVDVLVLNPEFHLEKDFERGVDWWLPKRGTITIRSDVSEVLRKETWYQNGNGCTLCFGAKVDLNTPPGLYLPDSDFVIGMRMHEALQGVYRGAVQLDDDVVDAFRERLDLAMGTRLSSHIPSPIKEQVLYLEAPDSDQCRPGFIQLAGHDFNTSLAIKREVSAIVRDEINELRMPAM